MPVSWARPVPVVGTTRDRCAVATGGGLGRLIQVCYSNRTEALFEAFAADIDRDRAAGRSALEPVRVVVGNRHVEGWLRLELARRDGIAACLEISQLRRFAAETLGAAFPGTVLVDRALLEELLLGRLLGGDALDEPEFAPLCAWLGAAKGEPEARELRCVQLASRLATLYEEYVFARPELVCDWPTRAALGATAHAETEAWQRRLWNELFAPGGAVAARGARDGVSYTHLAELLVRVERAPLRLDTPIRCFGVSHVARAFQMLLARLGEATTVQVYTLNPCREYWDDLVTVREAARQPQRVGPEALDALDPYALAAPPADEPPLLALWGRPGRENVRLLNELTDCTFHEAFVEPAGDTLLARLQRDILLRAPASAPPTGAVPDGSVRIFACPGIRRELEAIASEIWSLVKQAPAGAPLRFQEIALLIAGDEREAYLAQLPAVFDEHHRLPYRLTVAPAGGSRIAEAVGRLFALPRGRFERSELLALLGHDSVRGRWDDAAADEWAAWCEATGIVHGADRDDHAGTYLEGYDRHNWDQGLRRLALGHFLAAERSDTAAPLTLGEFDYLPEEQASSGRDGQMAFALLARSVIADARYARSTRLGAAAWAELLEAMVVAYVVPRGEDDEREFDRCLRAVRELSRIDLDGREVGYRVASELVAARLDAGAGGSPLAAGGVVVSTLQPLRALPFRAVFVAGLGEGRFPATDRRDRLDLIAARRRAGDVSPRERDEYAFLETLLSARERLVLSYVARDEVTGDALAPSSIIGELERVVARSYLPEPVGARRLVTQVPLRRWHAAAAVLPTAARDEHDLAAARDLLGGDAAPRELETLFAATDPASHPALAAKLKLTSSLAPARALAPPSGTQRISLAALRKFVECPLQGGARLRLGLNQDDEDDNERLRDDEPFETGLFDKLALLRGSLSTWVRAGETEQAPLTDEYRRRVEQATLAGHAPIGVFGEVERVAHDRTLGRWREQLATLLVAAPGGEVVRFGAAVDGDDIEVLAPAILLPVGAVGAPVPVELVGPTQLLVCERRVSVIAVAKPAPKGKDQDSYAWQKSLPGFFDHVALSALGLASGDEHTVQLLHDDHAALLVRFRPIARDVARAWLSDLVRELQSTVHDYVLPCEAIFRAWGGPGSGFEGLGSVLQQILDASASHASTYGPLRNYARYRLLDEADAARSARVRLGLFFDSLVPPEATTPVPPPAKPAATAAPATKAAPAPTAKAKRGTRGAKERP